MRDCERFDIPAELGLRIGRKSLPEDGTGLTVLLFDKPARAGMHVCSGAAGTRQCDSLSADHVVQHVSALLFSGGSSFGLDASGGVIRHLREKGVGTQTPYGVVPSCPTAVIFDIGFKKHCAAPTADDAYEACINASMQSLGCGSVGAGTGATVGKLKGMSCAMKGGEGLALYAGDGLFVLALAVVNSYGEVFMPELGKVLAGMRKSADSLELENSLELVRSGGYLAGGGLSNTTLLAIVTNAALDKSACSRVARMASAGIARSIRPAFTPADGDIVFCFSCGEHQAGQATLGAIAAEISEQAIRRAVITADGLGVIPAHKDVYIE